MGDAVSGNYEPRWVCAPEKENCGPAPLASLAWQSAGGSHTLWHSAKWNRPGWEAERGLCQPDCPKSDKQMDNNVRNKATVKPSYTFVPALPFS